MRGFANELFQKLVAGTEGAFHTAGIVLRRESLLRVGLFYEPFVGAGVEDTELWIRMAATLQLRPGRIAEPVSVRSVHDQNMVFRPHHIRRRARFLMWRRLLKWSVAQHLPICDRDLLAQRFLQGGRRGIRHTHLPGTICRRLEVLAEAALRHPPALRSAYLLGFSGTDPWVADSVRWGRTVGTAERHFVKPLDETRHEPRLLAAGSFPATAGQWRSQNQSARVPPPGNSVAEAHSGIGSKWLPSEFVHDLVSIVIPTYNRAEMLREAIASTNRQSYRPIEILVVDDGSAGRDPRSRG